jgi:hypothetical protein
MARSFRSFQLGTRLGAFAPRTDAAIGRLEQNLPSHSRVVILERSAAAREIAAWDRSGVAAALCRASPCSAQEGRAGKISSVPASAGDSRGDIDHDHDVASLAFAEGADGMSPVRRARSHGAASAADFFVLERDECCSRCGRDFRASAAPQAASNSPRFDRAGGSPGKICASCRSARPRWRSRMAANKVR